jgi:hypothetical protein
MTDHGAGRAMTAAQKRKRRSAIISELTRMSRDWSRYTAVDWLPLEEELEGLKA